MRVLFIEPPPVMNWSGCHSGITTAGRRHPGLNFTGEKVYSYLNLSAAAVLREQDHEVFYIHCQTENVTLDKLKERILEITPNMLVIMVEHINLNVSNAVAQIAKANKDMRVTFVGPLATSLDREIIKLNCDYVIRKEWDYALYNLVEAIENKTAISEVRGITYKENGKIKRTDEAELIEDLDSLPFPAYDLVDISKFYEAVFSHFPTATGITSRGCPYKCVFCSFPKTIYSRKFRAQSPERVLEEAKYLKEKFSVKAIRYDDDTFDIDTKRVLRICELFRKEKLGIKWIIQSRPALMTYEIAKELKSAGCDMVLFGVESGDDKVLKAINKETTTEEIKRGVRNAQKAGLDILNCVMLGFYWDTEETIQKTIDFAFELNAEFTQFSTPIPLPGTDYYKLLAELGFIVSDKWENADSFHNSNVDFPHLSNEYINEVLKGIYKRYYVRPDYVWKMFKRTFKSKDNFIQIFRLIRAFYQRHQQNWM